MRTPTPANEMAAKPGSVSGTGTWPGASDKRSGEMMGESPFTAPAGLTDT
jgi:hypothetical protein